MILPQIKPGTSVPRTRIRPTAWFRAYACHAPPQSALGRIVGPWIRRVLVRDEPGKEVFPTLGGVNQYLLKKDPKHLPYINLLPNYANHPDWLGAAYEPIVAQYMEIVKPALVSWDSYRQMFEGGDESFYWKNL